MPTCNDYGTEGERAAIEETREIILDEVDRFYIEALSINNVEQLYHKYVNIEEERVYILDDKCGESGRVRSRVKPQDPSGRKNKFLLMPPNEMVDCGFVGRDAINQLMDPELRKRHPLLGGIHDDNLDRLRRKLTRQFGEGNTTSTFEFRDGAIFEFTLRSPPNARQN